MNTENDIRVQRVIETDVHELSYARAVERILEWAGQGQSRYVCLANVHMLMECCDNPAFAGIVNSADLAVPDGRPVYWALRLMGRGSAEHIRGADLTKAVLAESERLEIPVGFYGGKPETLQRMIAQVAAHYPGLRIRYTFSPPFRDLTPSEDEAATGEINGSGARVLFLGLGCPKQEKWMAVHRGKIEAVMLGVGAAFDFLAGEIRPAPRWMQRTGFEWLFRLIKEPRRLWRRYARHNPRFVIRLALQMSMKFRKSNIKIG